MADEQAQSYGYETDEVKVSPFSFGLNAGQTFLTKLEWIANGGKDGAEQEALEIIFNIAGTEKSYRKFPVTKAFGKDNVEITDPLSQEFKDEVKALNAVITHIMHAFVDDETYRAAISRPITSFKDFCTVIRSVLPKDFDKKPLDIFLQWQWQPTAGKDRTYLDIPPKMKQGAWLKPAQPGNWKEVRLENFNDNTQNALHYINDEGLIHPIMKNGWFMKSAYANQTKPADRTNSNVSNLAGTGTGNVNAAAGVAQNTGAKPATW